MTTKSREFDYLTTPTEAWDSPDNVTRDLTRMEEKDARKESAIRWVKLIGVLAAWFLIGHFVHWWAATGALMFGGSVWACFYDRRERRRRR